MVRPDESATDQLLVNQPLARTAAWFLALAVGVALLVCFAIFHARQIADDFNHPALLHFGVIASAALFGILVLTAAALGFLSNCRTGRTAGLLALIAFVLGGAAIAGCYWIALLHAVA